MIPPSAIWVRSVDLSSRYGPSKPNGVMAHTYQPRILCAELTALLEPALDGLEFPGEQHYVRFRDDPAQRA